MTKTIMGGIAATAVAVVAIVGLYQLGWWAEEDAVNRRAEIADESFARQSALRDEALDYHETVLELDVALTGASESQRPALEAQRANQLDRFCDSWGLLNSDIDLPRSVETYGEENCR